MSDRAPNPPAAADAPLQDFSRCHEEFVALLADSLGLPAKLAAAAEARACAADLLKMFRDHLLAHHDDEERDLFPAVIQVARPGDEAARAQAMVTQLVKEHREIAQIWKQLEPKVQSVANGYLPTLDAELLQELVRRFNEHVRAEEEEFLPFAQRVLARQSQDMTALGLALHRRHEATEVMARAVVYGPT